jgi:imidazole glycerol phosphate synthase glutamine amidotransferase subunit
MKVAIAAYGAGNVRSVKLALARLGHESLLVHDSGPLLDADLAVLPGVGSAATAMAGLRERGLDEALRLRLSLGRPILGICLGLQLALDESEEDGGVAGLGLVPGRAVRLRQGRVPRIGWAIVEPDRAGGDRGENAPGEREAAYWFAHSYVAESPATTATSEGLAAAVEHGSFLGVQFHPEKSGLAGRRFLQSYLDRCLSLV